MPLLNKKPFKKVATPTDLHPDEEIFFCEPTKEVFRNYDDFFERMILCNSLLWSCELSGRCGLTYLEARQAEKTARKSLNTLPVSLKKAVLFLCSRMHKTGLKDLLAEMMHVIKERFFIGEPVQIQLDNTMWAEGCVSVIEVAVSTGGDTSSVHHTTTNTDTTHQHVMAGEEVEAVVAPADVLYRVRLTDQTVRQVTASRLRRDRRLVTTDRVRLLLRHSTHAVPTVGGRLVLRPAVASRWQPERMCFSDVFVGAVPVFNHRPAVKQASASSSPVSSSAMMVNKMPVNGSAEHASDTALRQLKQLTDATALRSPASTNNDDRDDLVPLSVMRDETQRHLELQRQRLNEQRVHERDRRRLVKKQLYDWLKDWSRPREDLLCEDHKELPVFATVRSRLPAHLFAGCLQLLEFVDVFGSLFGAPVTFNFEGGGDVSETGRLSVAMLESALLDNQVTGVYVQLVQVMLRGVLQLHKQEMSAVLDNSSGNTGSSNNNSQCGDSQVSVELLDSLTVTELLRQHLTSHLLAEHIRWRWHRCGCFSAADCARHHFQQQHHSLLSTLSRHHVLSLSPDERLAVLECLMHELLMCAPLRAKIDQADCEIRELRMQLRSLRASIAGLHRSLAMDRPQERRDEGAGKSGGALPDGDVLPPPPPPQPAPAPAEIDLTDTDASGGTSAAEWRDKLRQQREAEATCQRRLVTAGRCVALQPCGSDRAGRQYWLVPSVPALLIQRQQTGHCLSAPSRHCTRLATAGSSTAEMRQLVVERLRQQLQQRRTGQQAADSADSVAPSAAVITVDDVLAQDVDLTAVLARLTAPSDTAGEDEADVRQSDAGRRDQCLTDGECVEEDVDFTCDAALLRTLLLCTADGACCVVHGGSETTETAATHAVWSVCADSEQLKQLVDSLNQRGLRESELRTSLAQLESVVGDMVQRCPCAQLTSTPASSSSQSNTAASQDSSCSQNSCVADIEELMLRDLILDLEDQLNVGALGSLQVDDREAWREAIEQRSHCDSNQHVHLHNEPHTGTCVVNGTPADHRDDSDTRHVEASQSGVMRQLSTAVLQLEQAVQRRFLSRPLVDSRDSGSSPLQSWRRAVACSTSLSQLCVHVAVLRRAVLWRRSVTHARCKICRRKSQPDAMLLCDSCNAGYHMFCLKPPLKRVPEGDWFCVECQPSSSEHQHHRGSKRTAVSAAVCVDSPEQRPSNKRRRVSTEWRYSPTVCLRRLDSEQCGGRLDTQLLRQLQCDLRRQDSLAVFLRPVRQRDAPMYHTVVHEPMDLGTIQHKLDAGQYTSNTECLADTALVFANCCMYNQPDSQIHRHAVKLRHYFKRRVAELRLDTARTRRSV